MSALDQHNRPNEDDTRGPVEGHPPRGRVGEEPQGVERTIADADKEQRSGTPDEPVRNTPPAGAWNDTTYD